MRHGVSIPGEAAALRVEPDGDRQILNETFLEF
jgi:hypothetical protein